MAEEEESRITDEHRAFIGRKAEPVFIVIDEQRAREMRETLGDNDPRWAEGTGIAPPYAISMMDPARRMIGPRIFPSGILTAHEWNFARPIRIGERLKAIAQVTDIRERLGGRYGWSVLVTTRIDMYDEDDNFVAATTAVGTQFDPAAVKQE
jgi:acyl dehydratase